MLCDNWLYAIVEATIEGLGEQAIPSDSGALCYLESSLFEVPIDLVTKKGTDLTSLEIEGP